MREGRRPVTQHNGVCGACMTLLVRMTVGWVSARLWRDSREREKDGGRREVSDGRMTDEKRRVGEEGRDG